MKVDGFHIDGYGVHHELSVTDLPDGLTIVAGPNEAGKTTLQHFLVGMLFGFTPSNRDDHHAPLRGGTYGGRLLVRDDAGRPLTIHRGARRSSLRITDVDGPVPDAELADLLGGATRDLYESIFAVHIDELAELRALKDDAVRDRVFSAGVLGAGRTAQRALTDLADQRDALLKPGGRSPDKYAIKKLRTELAAARAQLAEVRRTATGLPALVQRLESIERDRLRARTQREALAAERALLAAVDELWPAWAEAADARAALHRLGAVPVLPDGIGERLTGAVARTEDLEQVRSAAAQTLAEAEAAAAELPTPGATLAHAAAITEVAAAAGAEHERAEAIADLEQTVERLRAELAGALAAIGPDCDETWLSAHPERAELAAELRAHAGSVAAAAQQRTNLAESQRRASAELDDAEADLRAAEAALAAAPAHPAERARQVHADSTVLVALVTQREDALHRAAADHPPEAAPAAALPSFLVPALVVVGVVALAAGGAAVAGGAPVAGLLALIVGAGLAALGAIVHRGAAATTAVRPAPSADAAAHQVAEIDRTLQPILTSLALSSCPTVAEAAKYHAKAGQLADEAAHLDRERAERARQRMALDERRTRHLERSSAELAAADAAIEVARAGWAAWLEAQGLPATLDPAAAADLVDATARAHAAARALQAARADLARTRLRLGAYTERVTALLSTEPALTALAEAEGLDPAIHPVAVARLLATALQADRDAERRTQEAAITLDAAQAAFDSAADRANGARTELDAIVIELGARTAEEAHAVVRVVEQAAALQATIDRADRDLRAAVGTVSERLDQARSLLAQADPPAWRHEIDRLERDRLAIDSQIDELVAERAHLQREQRELEQSADVPTAELHVTDLEAQLLDAVTTWASLTIAHQLVEGTLARYQRERQPDVVKRAAAHFEQITGGRYPRLEVRDHDILAIDRTEREVPANELSQGTIEQLYLCMRFALAESYAKTARLPLLLDDITVNADDMDATAHGSRVRRLADTIAAVAAHQQVLIFTHHQSTVELLQAAAPEARLISLEPSATTRRIGLAAG